MFIYITFDPVIMSYLVNNINKIYFNCVHIHSISCQTFTHYLNVDQYYYELSLIIEKTLVFCILLLVPEIYKYILN